MKWLANKPNPAKPAIAPGLHVQHHWRGLADSGRSTGTAGSEAFLPADLLKFRV